MIYGANEFKILVSVVLPIAMPILATLSLLVGLAYWNDWTNGLYYINDARMFIVQVLLMNIQRNHARMDSYGYRNTQSGQRSRADMVL